MRPTIDFNVRFDWTSSSLTNTIKSSGRTPALAAGEPGTTDVDVSGRAVHHVGNHHQPEVDRREMRGLASSDFGGGGVKRPAMISPIGPRSCAERDGVVDPRVAVGVAQFASDHADQPAVERGQRPAGRAGIIRHRIDDIDRPFVGGSDTRRAARRAGPGPQSHRGRPRPARRRSRP